MKHVVIVLLVLLCGCSQKPAERTHIRMAVGGVAQFVYLPAALAPVLGFPAEEGLDLSIEDFQGGAKSLEALMGGSVDVVCGFYDHTIQMAAQGREIKAFLTMLRYPGLVLVAADPAVKSIEDLKGKAVGVSALGSSSHMYLNHQLLKHGLKPEDVSSTAVGMAGTAIAAMTHHTIAAAIMTDPSLDVVRKTTPLRVLSDTRTGAGVKEAYGVDVYPASVLYSTTQWLTQHATEATKLTRAMQRTMEWMRSHSVEEIYAKMPAANKTADSQADIEGLKAFLETLSTDGRMPADAPEAVRSVLALSNEQVRNAKIDLTKTYTNEFVK